MTSERRCAFVCDIPESQHATEEHPFFETGQVERLAAGIKAAVVLRIIAEATDRLYTATEVSELASAAVDEQVQRLGR